MQNWNYLPLFQYPPLDKARREIRLITICPSSQQGDSNIVECSIKISSLKTKVKYLAVSYVWGAPSPTHKLLINGEGPEYPQALCIGPNINEALRSFRNQKAIRENNLWIDAICINQTDNDEKSWQVACMKSIYEQAVQVLAWLGPSNIAGKSAFDMLNALEQRLEESGPDLEVERFEEFAEVLAKDLGSGGNEIQKIIDRPWFQRIWVQQEFLVAREVEFVCGEYSFRWEALFIASTTIKNLRRVTFEKTLGQNLPWDNVDGELLGLNPNGPETDMFRMRCDFQGNEDVYTLWDLLISAKGDGIRSTDPRDSIFALFGLASDSPGLGIVANYDLTHQDCFTQASKAMLRQGHLRLLWFSSHRKVVKDLPSWVPDWSSEWDLSYYVASYCKRDLSRDLPTIKDGNFTAGNSCEVNLSFKTVDSKDLLVIRGLLYDRILTASPILGNSEEYNPFNYLLEAIKLIQDIANGCMPRASIEIQDIVRTLLYDTELRYDGHGLFDALDDINVSIRLTPGLLARITDYVINDRGEPNADLNGLESFLRIRMANLKNHRIFITSSGSIGIGWAWIKPGDIVAIFHGAEMPFVLQEDCVACEIYNLMGEAYVHGIMYGEFARGESDAREFQIY